MQRREARWVQKGTIGTTAPRRCEHFAHSAKKLVTMRSDAQLGRVLHTVAERTGFRSTLSVLNACTAFYEKGHNRTDCANSQCANTPSFWTPPNDCPCVSCVDVAIDWLNLLASTKSPQVVNAYFEDVSLQPSSLRIHGILEPFSDWDHLQRSRVLVTAQQLLEVICIISCAMPTASTTAVRANSINLRNHRSTSRLRRTMMMIPYRSAQFVGCTRRAAGHYGMCPKGCMPVPVAPGAAGACPFGHGPGVVTRLSPSRLVQ